MSIRVFKPDKLYMTASFFNGFKIFVYIFNCISFLYFLFVNDFNVFLSSPQQVMKTKYTDTLIKLLSPTYLLTYFNTVVI